MMLSMYHLSMNLVKLTDVLMRYGLVRQSRMRKARTFCCISVCRKVVPSVIADSYSLQYVNLHTERLLGGLDVFVPYAKDYVSTFRGKSIRTDQWKDHLYGYFSKHGGEEKIKILDSVDWDVSETALTIRNINAGLTSACYRLGSMVKDCIYRSTSPMIQPLRMMLTPLLRNGTRRRLRKIRHNYLTSTT